MPLRVKIVLVSQTTQAESVRLIGVEHVAEATAEAQVPAIGTAALCTAPVVAAGTAIAERTIAVEQVASSMEL